MNKKVHTRILSLITLQRNILFFVSVIMFIIIFLLSIKVYNSETTVVLVPNFFNSELKLSNKKVSDSYLEAISRDVILTMLNITPNNIKYAEDSILTLIHPSFYGQIKEQFNTLKQDIKKRKLSTVFYPSQIITNSTVLTSTITGELRTYIGKKEVSRRQTSYKLGYDYSAGKLSIINFYEMTKEQIKEGK